MYACVYGRVCVCVGVCVWVCTHEGIQTVQLMRLLNKKYPTQWVVPFLMWFPS